MRSNSFLLAVLLKVIVCQDNVDKAIEQVFGLQNGTNGIEYEEVTSKPLESLGEIPRCGDGDNTGLLRCVPYYACNTTNNIVEDELPTNGLGVINIR